MGECCSTEDVESNKTLYDMDAKNQIKHATQKPNQTNEDNENGYGCKQMGTLERMDFALSLYYNQFDRKDYFDDDGRGKFILFVEEYKFDKNQLDLELGSNVDHDPNDNIYVLLDDDFPLNNDTNMNETEQVNAMINVLRYCYKYGQPPNALKYATNRSRNVIKYGSRTILFNPPNANSENEKGIELQPKDKTDEEKYIKDHKMVRMQSFYDKNIKHDPKLIGEGKFGKIYLAEWNDKTVAVKEYKHKKDYFHEIKVIKHIDSFNRNNKYDHLTTVHGISNESVVFEFMSRGSADKLFYFNSKNNIRNEVYILDVIDVLIDVCKGMKCLHEMNVVHRDLSARNLLFEPNNNADHNDMDRTNMKKFVVKLCDFGEAEISKNKTKTRKGPYLWLAPESIRKQICNIKTDIYAFGILCYELLIGTRPFPNTPIEVAVIEILSLSMRPNINYYNKLIPLQLLVLIQRCWQQIPQYRPDDFSAILEKLGELRRHIIEHKYGDNGGDDGDVKLDEIVFDENKSKEMLKDLKDLSHFDLKFMWLSHDNNKKNGDVKDFDFKKKTKNELLAQIFDYTFDEETDIAAIEYYINYFPWFEEKPEKLKIASRENIAKWTKQFNINLRLDVNNK